MVTLERSTRSDAARLTYQFEMLGAFRVRLGDVVLDRFQTQKTASLLAYLAYFPDKRHSRESLIDQLWPDAAPDAGRSRLSQALTWLRRQIEAVKSVGAPTLDSDRLSIQLRLNSASVDALTFDEAVRAAPSMDSTALRRAVDLYRGILLPNLYEEWIARERDRLETSYGRAAHLLVDALMADGEIETAIDYARSAIAVDRLNEEAHCDLIRALAMGGRTSEALLQFQTLERRLAQEIDARPSAQARALANALRAQTDIEGPADARFARGEHEALRFGSRSIEAQDIPDISRGAGRRLYSALPAPLTRFFGREEEIERLKALVASNDERLVTLTGVGGAGKTRLACEAARQIYADGLVSVAFVPLAELSEGLQIASAIANGLRLPTSTDTLLLDQIAQRLSRAPTLLLLDNLEHLAGDPATASLIRQLLERVPTLTILATSRYRIGVDGERELPVAPLPAPRGGPAFESQGVASLIECASVEMFVDRARAVRPDFHLTPSNGAIVAQLCDRLEGIPLAIELCAAWAQTLTPEQMMEKLDRRFELLVSRRKDIAPRHRTLRSAIEYGYLQLPDDLKAAFVRLAVFRGGWTLAAAEAYLDESEIPTDDTGDADSRANSALNWLTELRERSLIFAVETTNGGGGSEMRYRMLETLREFAVEVFSHADEVKWRGRHADYFLRLAEEAEIGLFGSDQGQWLATLEAEHDNIRAALSWALIQGRTEFALRLSGAVGRFWQTRGYLREGREWLIRALESASPQPDGPEGQPIPDAVVAKAWSAFGHLAWSRGDYDEAHAAHTTALRLRRAVGEPIAIAESLFRLGITEYRQSHPTRTRELLQESLDISKQASDPSGISRVLLLYGNLARMDGDLLAARDYYEQSLAIERSIGNRQRSADALNNLGLVARSLKDYPRATAFYRDALAIRRELTDVFGAVTACINLGAMLRRQGQPEASREMLAEGINQAEESGNKHILAHGLIQLGLISIEAREWERGVTAISAGVQLYSSIGSAFTDEDTMEYLDGLEIARTELPEPLYVEALERGRRTSLRDAVNLSLGSAKADSAVTA